MRMRRRRRSHLRSRRNRSGGIIPFLVMVSFLGLFVWSGWKLLSFVLSDVRSESVSAEIQILKGRAEFSFPESEEWTPAYSEQTFLEGDSVRTSANTRVSLEFLGGNMIFLDENTHITFAQLEEKSSGKKNVHIDLTNGRMWSRVSGDDFTSDSESEFVVQTERMKMVGQESIFDINSSTHQDSLRLIKGTVHIDVFTGENKKEDFQNIEVGVGQKVVVSPVNVTRLENNEDILEIVDTEFIESEWHLKNLERFFPQEATQIRRKIEVSAPRPLETEEPKIETSNEVESPKILTPQNNARVGANQEAVKIEGTAPPQAVQIVVNGYTLTRFKPGDRKWAYFASKKFGTLLPGQNTYSVVAITDEGKKSNPATVEIFFEGTAETPTEAKPETITSSIDEFKAPVITRPAVASLDEPYQTSSDVVTISGIVDPKTNTVEVNGFKLKQFEPGQTEFKYLANARYGNMKEGENTYEVTALGPDGKKAITNIKIVYTPLQVGE